MNPATRLLDFRPSWSINDSPPPLVAAAGKQQPLQAREGQEGLRLLVPPQAVPRGPPPEEQGSGESGGRIVSAEIAQGAHCCRRCWVVVVVVVVVVVAVVVMWRGVVVAW